MFEKEKSLKLQKWTKKDVALVAITYIINVIVFSLLFVGMCFLNSVAEGETFEEVISNSGAIVDFVIIISLILAITAVYFAFENRDFLRKASNSQMCK